MYGYQGTSNMPLICDLNKNKGLRCYYLLHYYQRPTQKKKERVMDCLIAKYQRNVWVVNSRDREGYKRRIDAGKKQKKLVIISCHFVDSDNRNGGDDGTTTSGIGGSDRLHGEATGRGARVLPPPYPLLRPRQVCFLFNSIAFWFESVRFVGNLVIIVCF